MILRNLNIKILYGIKILDKISNYSDREILECDLKHFITQLIKFTLPLNYIYL